MKETKIQIRDTWKGYENEEVNFRFGDQDGTWFFEKEKVVLPGSTSLAYENATIVMPKVNSDKIHPLIHEVVHFMQHNTLAMDDAYFRVGSYTLPEFKKFLNQREETEAHFIQMLFISRYEFHLVKERERPQFKNRFEKCVTRPAMRVDSVFWAVKNQIL